MIVVDTLRSDRMSCYGYPRPTTPVIDSLAQGGVLFEDNTAQWPWTLPSTVTLFQGRYLTNYHTRLDEELPSIVELFKDAGYTTIGVLANCAVNEGRGFARGFDHFDVNDCWTPGSDAAETDPDVHTLRQRMLGPVTEALAAGPAGERPPLFLYLHAFDPHGPYKAHEELDAVLPPDQAPPVVPADFWEAALGERGPAPPLNRANGWSGELKALAIERGRYDQEVRHFDAGLGLILKDLKRLGINRDTVYALVSDHGEGLWDHLTNDSAAVLAEKRPKQFFYAGHGGAGYQNVMATPFILWGHGLPAGRRVPDPVENVDLVPTLLELADIPLPEGLDGRSLLALLEGAGGEPWREFTYCFGAHTMSIRHVPSGYKLILPHGKRSEMMGKPIELFDLVRDPWERTNLAEQEPERVAWLVREVNSWLEANPTESTMEGSLEEQNAESRKKLIDSLNALGYTELETGISED